MQRSRNGWRIAGIGFLLGAVLLAGCMLFQPKVVVDLEASPVAGVAPYRVDFTPIVEEDVAAYQWGFGDGGTSTATAPTHIYRDEGTFTVTLTVVLADGRVGHAVKTDLIEVSRVFQKAGEPGALYWLDRSTGTISAGYRNGYDSWTVINGIVEADSVAVGGGKLYWTAGRKVEWANVDGSEREVIAHGQDDVMGIAVDVEGGKIYFACIPVGIRRANLDGTSAMTWAGAWECEDTYPTLLAVDSDLGKLVWFEIFHDVHCVHFPVSLNGPKEYSMLASIHSTHLSSFRDRELIHNLSDSGGIALDVGLSAGARYVYWTNPSANRINRCRLDGTEFAWIVNGTFDPRGIAADAAEGKIYWSGQLGIFRANLDGSQVELIFPDVHADALALEP